MSEGASKPFASSADTEDKPGVLEELADGVYAYTAEGDPNVGCVVGDDAVLVVDARSTPSHAREWIEVIRSEITDRPIRWMALTHYHAVRVLGAAAFGVEHIVAHRRTYQWIAERGEADFESEARRFPRLFRDIDSVPGLTWPTLTFEDEMAVDLGGRWAVLRWFGRGHTAGDAVVWVPESKTLFAGDLVEARATPYCGDAYLGDWSTTTLDRLRGLGATSLVGGRGPAVRGGEVDTAVEDTRAYLRILLDAVAGVVRDEGDLKTAFDAAYAALQPRFGDWWIFEHCIPFNVARAYDEVTGADPRVWTASRDQEVWKALQG